MKLMIIGVTLAGFAAFTPLSAQRPSGNQRTSGQNCTNSQSSGSVSDVILGRRSASTVGCVDNRTNQRVNRTNQQVNGGGWYQVGNDGNGGTIYERQVQDQYGNVVVQRARRDRNGNMSIISTRNVGNNGTYNNGTYNNNRRSGDGDRDDQGNYQNGHHDNGNHYGQYKNGKGHGKNKDRGNKHGDD
ncbi:MAG TPA: hypothetical protein VIM36_10875 [Gemmatimonadaceae bacterium]|jgi:hypothetical protein